MTLSTVTALAKLFGQYLLQPIPFTLTFLLPLLFRLIARKYIWLTLPLTALAEVLLNWDSFCYYEARGERDGSRRYRWLRCPQGWGIIRVVS